MYKYVTRREGIKYKCFLLDFYVSILLTGFLINNNYVLCHH